jgi:hypothetical protein
MTMNPISGLVSIVIRGYGVTHKWCREKKQARQLVNSLINIGIDSTLSHFNEHEDFQDKYFNLVAPAPRGILVVDTEEMVILDYHDGPRPCRIGLAEAMIHLKERKLCRPRPVFDDLYQDLSDALQNDRILHVELGKKIYPRPFDREVPTFVAECKRQFGPGWFGAQAVINPAPWAIEWYGPWPNKNNGKAILERIRDMGIEVGKEDASRWSKHFRNLRYEFLH